VLDLAGGVHQFQVLQSHFQSDEQFLVFGSVEHKEAVAVVFEGVLDAEILVLVEDTISLATSFHVVVDRESLDDCRSFEADSLFKSLTLRRCPPGLEFL